MSAHGHNTDWDSSSALCGERMEHGRRSREHVIPNVIGGGRKVRRFLCRRCNAKATSKWDDELARRKILHFDILTSPHGNAAFDYETGSSAR